MPSRRCSIVGVVTVLVTQASPILGQAVREQTDTSQSLIEMRLARQGDAPGFQRTIVAGSGEVVYVSNEPLFTAEAFEHVEARVTPTGLLLRARLKSNVAPRMAAVQRGEVGNCCEFLAILIEGELVNAPRIVVDPDAVATPTIDVAMPASTERAEGIAGAISARWPEGGR